LEDKTRAVTEKLAQKIGGEKARQFIQDFNAISSFLGDARFVDTTLDGIDAFLKTGEITYLNPFALHIANQLKYIYDKIKNMAHSLPGDILEALPSEVRQIAAGATWLTEQEADIGHMSAPHVAFGRRDVGAMTIFDIIVWQTIPPSANGAGLHTWSHELFHVRQYRDAGNIEKFIARYIANELGFKSGSDENEMEVDADLFACRFFPQGQPHYLPGNVCP
jgi:hypothetical protein